MPIVTPQQYRQMLDTAQKGNYAYPAINVTSMLTANAALKGFAESKSDGMIQVSTGGGMKPIWSPKEDELYYRSLSVTEIMVVAVETKVGFMRQRPRVLFEGNYLDVIGMSYDIYPDGEHFLMLKGTEEGTTRTQLNVVTNWFEEVKRKVPTDN